MIVKAKWLFMSLKGGLVMKISRCSLLAFTALLIIGFSSCITVPQDENLEAKVNELELRVEKLEGKKIQSKEKAVGKEVESPKGVIDTVESVEESDDNIVVIRFPSNEEIQLALKNAGFYKGKIDGQLGPETRNAIMEFQRENGLRADGVIGRNTWELLGEFFIPEELEEDDSLELEDESLELEEDDSLELEEKK